MYNHEPPGYSCLFCRIVQQAKEDPALTGSDVIHQTESVTAFLGLGRWPGNPVDVLIVPNEHFEHLYDLPLRLAPALHETTRSVALALKEAFQCDGVSTRQHNEPPGDQDVWHFHIHVTPRSTGDDFYRSHKIPFPNPSASKALDSYESISQISNHENFSSFTDH